MPLTLATVTPGEPEIFASLQGEGASAGRPSTFVRLSRCNLACVWCDTAYTWRFGGDNRPHRAGIAYERAANQITLDEASVAERVLALPPERLVVTGGEPMLQAAALARMLAVVKQARPAMHVEIESNASVALDPRLSPLVDQFNLSPKLSHSGNAEVDRLRPEVLAAYAADPRTWFKFVVAEPADVEEVAALVEAYALPRPRVLLMPEGTDSATLRGRMGWLADAALTHGFGLSDRLHIHLYGDTRGT